MEQLTLTAKMLSSAAVLAEKTDPYSYNCPKCGKSYSRSHSLNRHIKFECGVEPRFECPICHKKSKHKHNLMLHMRIHREHSVFIDKN